MSCDNNSNVADATWVLERYNTINHYGVNFGYYTFIGVFTTEALAQGAASTDMLSRAGQTVSYRVRQTVIDQLYPYGLS